MDLGSFVGSTWRPAYHYIFLFNEVKPFRVLQTNYLIAVYSRVGGGASNVDLYVLLKGKFSHLPEGGWYRRKMGKTGL